MIAQSLSAFALAGAALAAPQMPSGPPSPPELGPVPEPGPPSFGEKFGINADGTNITNVSATASEGRIFIGGTQSPECENDARQDFATFKLYSDGTVFLFGYENPPQQLWVDASGMGGGISGYYTVGESKPRNAGVEGFSINDDGNLVFGEVGTKACPTDEEGKYSIWFTNSEKPGFQDGCEDVELKAQHYPHREACKYSE